MPSRAARWISAITLRSNVADSRSPGCQPAISGSSRDVPLERTAAGAARQGRRTGAMLVALPGPRTPHGGDQRSSISGGMLREGPLVHQAPLGRPAAELVAVGELELAQHGRDVRLDGLLGDVQ